MTPEEKRDVIYESILRTVIWDEPKEAVFNKLSANGFEGAEARAMYDQAVSERVASIRGDYLKKTGMGLLWLSGAAGFFCAFWYGMGGSTEKSFFLRGWGP